MKQHFEILKRYYGSHLAAAKKGLYIDPRHYRKIRNGNAPLTEAMRELISMKAAAAKERLAA